MLENALDKATVMDEEIILTIDEFGCYENSDTDYKKIFSRIGQEDRTIRMRNMLRDYDENR